MGGGGEGGLAGVLDSGAGTSASAQAGLTAAVGEVFGVCVADGSSCLGGGGSVAVKPMSSSASARADKAVADTAAAAAFMAAAAPDADRVVVHCFGGPLTPRQVRNALYTKGFTDEQHFWRRHWSTGEYRCFCRCTDDTQQRIINVHPNHICIGCSLVLYLSWWESKSQQSGNTLG
jgi:hypothetical protein